VFVAAVVTVPDVVLEHFIHPALVRSRRRARVPHVEHERTVSLATVAARATWDDPSLRTSVSVGSCRGSTRSPPLLYMRRPAPIAVGAGRGPGRVDSRFHA
jgi:hypothetical protein